MERNLGCPIDRSRRSGELSSFTGSTFSGDSISCGRGFRRWFKVRNAKGLWPTQSRVEYAAGWSVSLGVIGWVLRILNLLQSANGRKTRM